MDNDEVPEEGRILYATANLLNALLMMDTYKSKEILAAYTIKKAVPQGRFYTSIDLLDGKTPGEEAGHYRKGTVKYAKTTDTAVVSGKDYYTESSGVYSKVDSPQTSAIGTYYEMVQEAAKPINFMIIHKPAIIKHDKHVVSNIIPAASNPNADADIIKYRKYGLVDVYKNKVAGIYLSHQA